MACIHKEDPRLLGCTLHCRHNETTRFVIHSFSPRSVIDRNLLGFYRKLGTRILKDNSMNSSRKRAAAGDSEPQTTCSTMRESSTGDVQGYRELIVRSHSITMHPLGFVLTKFLHPNQNVKIPAELDFETNQSLEQMEQMQARRETELSQCVSTWTNWLEDGDLTRKEEQFSRSLTMSMNKVWSNKALYASHQDCWNWDDPATTLYHKSYSDIVVHRVKENGRNVKQDPAALLIDVGLAKYHPLTKVDEALYYEQTLLTMGLFVEPMLLALVRIVAEPGHFKKADLVVFLVVPRGNVDIRTALLWRGVPKTLGDFVGDFGRIMQATELVEDWKARGANIDYECLGPHCCRIGDQVRVEPQILIMIITVTSLTNCILCVSR
jgi:hypothetical protein